MLAQGIISISLNIFVSISKRTLSMAMLKFRRAAITWSKIGEGELYFLMPLKLDNSLLGIDGRERTDAIIPLPDL